MSSNRGIDFFGAPGQVCATARVPPAVAAAFTRGGRNLQRIRDEPAERATFDLWRAHGDLG